MVTIPTLIPTLVELAGDVDTPVSAYHKLSQKFDPYGSFLLESVSGQDKISRYSFIGFNPLCEIKAYPEQVVIRQGTRCKPSKERRSTHSKRCLKNS